MKKKLPILFLFFFNFLIAQSSNYIIGYQKGYQYGFCRAQRETSNTDSCLPPDPPLPPKDKGLSYDDGYADGITDGINGFRKEIKKNVIEFTKCDNIENVDELNRWEMSEKYRFKDFPSQQRDAVYNEISEMYQLQLNKIRRQEKILENNNINQEIIENDKRNVLREKSEQKEKQQINNDFLKEELSVKPTSNNLNNTLQSVSNGLQLAQIKSVNAYANSQNSVIQNRRKSMLNYYALKANFMQERYKAISLQNFNKSLRKGYYEAYFYCNIPFSFTNGKEVTVVNNCLILVEDNKIKELYNDGDLNRKIDFPEKYPEESVISNGTVRYLDKVSQRTYYVVLIDPFEKSDYILSPPPVIKSGKINIWTKRKKYKDEPVKIQVIDQNGIMINEIETKIDYYDNAPTDCSYSIPAGCKLDFLTMQTFNGFGISGARASKKDGEPISNGECRIVKFD